MTTNPTLEPPATPTTPRGILRDLRSRVSGRLHTPADPDWEAARSPWRINVVQRPLAVLDARDARDVIAAVTWAGIHEVPVAAQTTGHGALEHDGRSMVDDALVIRCTGLRDIRVDLARGTVWVGAGVRAGELLAALEGTGRTYLCGSNPSPTVVGMTLTGGLSWFGRAYGAGADSVRTVELVDGLGRLRRIRSDEPELFWAVRGAGGDFGVVTGVELALHPAERVCGGRTLWPVDRLHDVLRAFRSVTSTAPPELTVWLQVVHFPDIDVMPEQMRGRSFTAVSFTHLGDVDALEQHLRPLGEVQDAVMHHAAPLSLPEVGTIAEEPVEPTAGIEYGRLLTALDDTLLRALVDQVGDRERTPLMLAQLRHLGGALRTSGGSAFGAVPEEYLLQAIGVPAVPQLVAPIEAAIAALDVAVGDSSSGRAPLAFLGDEPTSRWWTPEVGERLVAVKRETDPLGLIRSNRPVGS